MNSTSKTGSIRLKVRPFLASLFASAVLCSNVAAQDAPENDPADGQPPEASSSSAPGSSEPSGQGEPSALPPIEVPQPSLEETSDDNDEAKPEEKAESMPTRPAKPRPRPRAAPPVTGAGGAATAGLGGGESEGELAGSGCETAWGPVDGFVATRSATGLKTDTPIVEIPQSISVITADRIDELAPIA